MKTVEAAHRKAQASPNSLEIADPGRWVRFRSVGDHVLDPARRKSARGAENRLCSGSVMNGPERQIVDRDIVARHLPREPGDEAREARTPHRCSFPTPGLATSPSPK